jgi:hypothetical protein
LSLDQVKKIIEEALANEAFYDVLMNRPEEIFRDHDLNDSEKMMIKNLAMSPYTHAKKGLLDTERLVVAALRYTPPSSKDV